VSRGHAAAADFALRWIEEQDAGLDLPLLVNREWADRMPWLVQGVTWRGRDDDFDLGLFGDTPVRTALDRWRALRSAVRCDAAVHARQVHGASIIRHDQAVRGLCIADAADGHVTSTPGLLLTVSIADCIPVSIADPERRTVALLHAGWRGLAAGMVEAGIRALADASGTPPDSFLLHLGPAICGDCYEVSPVVHERLGLDPPDVPTPVDLRAVAAARAIAAGMDPAAITRSSFCPRCDRDRFFSHRAGSAGRQLAILGVRRDDTQA
jgi:YfiH family protein